MELDGFISASYIHYQQWQKVGAAVVMIVIRYIPPQSRRTLTMAEPETATETDGNNPDDGDQPQTVICRRTSHETVLPPMAVTDQLTPYRATPSEHNRIASVQNIGPPQITDPDFQQAIADISLSSVPSGSNQETVKITNIITNLNVSRGTSRGAVDDSLDTMVEQRVESAKDIFVKTEAYENVTDALENDGHVFITGSPGSGKTTMALYIMSVYKKKKYTVRFLEDVKAFTVQKHFKHVPTLFVLDDVFGRFAPTPEINVRCNKVFDFLETHFKQLEEKRKNQNDGDRNKDDEASGHPENPLKIIMSSRTNISNHPIVTSMLQKYKTSLFRKSTIADLTIYELKELEKEEILKKHLAKARIDLAQSEITKIAKLEYKTLGFPYICQLFADSCDASDKALQFFMKPWVYLHDLISEIFLSGQHNYRAAVLLLMVLNHGGLNLVHLLCGRLVEDIAKVEEILPGISHLNSLNEAARNEIRTLVVSEGDEMLFSHPTICDVVAFVVGNRNPVFILENCSLNFIIERTKVSGDGFSSNAPSGGDLHNFTINLHQDAAMVLVERLAREITGGYIVRPLSHQCFTLESMVDRLFSNLSRHENFEKILHSHDNEYGRGFIYWSSFASTGPMTQTLFDKTSFDVSEILEGYLGCCMSGNVSSLRVLAAKSEFYVQVATNSVGDILDVKNETKQFVHSLSTAGRPTKTEVGPDKVTPRMHGDNKDKLIHIAAANGFTQIVELLLDTVCTPIDVKGGNDMTALMYSSYLGHTDLAVTLLKRGANPELLDEEGDNCLHLTCRGGSVDLAKSLIAETLDVNKRGEHGRTPLMYASYNGHEDIVKLLLEKGALPNPDVSSIDQKDNCLHLACVKGEIRIVQILLDEGKMDIEVTGQRNRTPLMYACRNGQLETAKKLVARHANISVLDETSFSCLHLAAMKGHVPTAEWLLSLNPGIVVDCTNDTGRTPLMFALQNGHADMVDWLITHGSDIALKDHSMVSCVHMAVQSGRLPLVELCLEKGQNVNSCSNSYQTPVMRACKQGDLNLVKCLVEKGANVNLGSGCLNAACIGGSLEMVEYLISTFPTIDINKCGPKNRTPVMTACFHGHTDIVEYLQSKGADILARDKFEQTCLHVACRSDHVEIAERLLEIIPIDDIDCNGMTPLMFAVKSKCFDLVDFLVEHGANMNIRNNHGQTTLHTSAWFGNALGCAKLLDLGMFVDIRDSTNRTPLMCVSKNRNDRSEVVNILVERGADINVSDENGDVCLHIAAKSGGHTATSEYLLDSGLDINTKGSHDYTPIMSACRSGNKEQFDLLLVKGADLHCLTDHGASCLHLACMSDTNDTHIPNELLDHGLNIDKEDDDNMTPVMYAISKDKVNILSLLLSRNASVSTLDSSGTKSSLLHYACDIQDISIETHKLLLERGLHVNAPNTLGVTPLMCAARQGNRAVVDLLINAGANRKAIDLNGHDCISHAETHGHCELGDYLSQI
ncbi:ankyrin-2-like [Haliotis cracherodii]|uniref:ankyrin-2-like n=1 Tax=Haliotis cracherodii TaxID=6455 RepID=UPI0039ECA65A